MLTPHSFDITVSLLFFLDYFERQSNNIYVIKYENLVRNQKESIESICDFMEIPFTEDMLDYGNNIALLQNYSSTLMGDKKMMDHARPHSLSIGRWQKGLSHEEMKKIVTTLGKDVFKRLGYYNDLKQALKVIGLDEVEVNPKGDLDILLNKYETYADRKLSYPGSVYFSHMARDNATMSAQLEQIKALLIMLRQGRLLKFFREIRTYSKRLF